MKNMLKSTDRKSLLFMILIFLYYLITRLYGISGHMNEYFDYDEGTYLMIARLINQGYFPYRDIFAVHPPLFYYMLALWLRIFGDDYVIGRLFSVFLGFLSLIVAYYVGKEVRDWKLGVAFAGLLAMDPLLIHVNPLVFHETSIELFTLLSLYYFVRYAKTKSLRTAYISLFWAGLGSTSKFTILPFALALYLTTFLSSNREISGYLENASRVILNRKQVFIGIMSYILITLISMSAIILWPTELVRKLMIVPGLHGIGVYGQIIPSAFLLAIWGILTVYIFKITYADKLIKLAVFSIKNIKSAILLALAFLLPKILIEGTLGVMISKDYVYQTYLAQGGRSVPILNLFMYVGDKFSYIHNNSLEFLIMNAIMLLFLFVVFFVWTLSLEVSGSVLRGYLKSLFVINFIVYFFVSPVLPNDRFLLPMWLVLYLLLLDFTMDVRFTKRQLMTVVSVFIILLLIVDFGIVYQYPKGKLKLIWACHSKEMRDELKEFIVRNNLANERFYAVNPMNAYYLNLQTEPYYIDTFGLIVLKGMNASQILANLSKSGVNYYIFSTWSYSWWDSGQLRKQLRALTIRVITSHQLLYSDSLKNGEILELYRSSKDPDRKLYLSTYKGTLQLWNNKSTIASIYVTHENTSYNYRTRIFLLYGKRYKVIQYSNESNKVTFELYLDNTSITLEFNEKNNVTLKFFKDIAIFKGDKLITTNKTTNIKSVDVYLSDIRLMISGEFELNKRDDKTLVIEGKKIRITKISG